MTFLHRPPRQNFSISIEFTTRSKVAPGPGWRFYDHGHVDFDPPIKSRGVFGKCALLGFLEARFNWRIGRVSGKRSKILTRKTLKKIIFYPSETLCLFPKISNFPFFTCPKINPTVKNDLFLIISLKHVFSVLFNLLLRAS